MSGYKYNGNDITKIFNPTTCQPPGGNAVTVFGANSNYFQYNSSDIIGSNGATNTSDDYMGTNEDNYGDNLPYTVNNDSTNIGNYLMVSHDGFGDVNNTYTIPSEYSNANRIRVLLVGGGGGHGGSGGNAKCKVDIAGGNSAEGHGGRGGYGGIGGRFVQEVKRKDLVDSTFAGNVTINLGSAGENGNDGSTPSKKAIAGQVTKAHGNDGNAGGDGGVSILSWTTANGTIPAMAAGGSGGGGGTGANAETKKSSNTSSKQGSPGTDYTDPIYGTFTSNEIANKTIEDTVKTDNPNFSTKWIGNQSYNTWLTYGGGGYQTSNGSTRDKVTSSVNGNNGYAIIVFLYD